VYKIYDWAGNRIGDNKFNTFEDAWDYILGDLTDKLDLKEEDYQEYNVQAEDQCGHIECIETGLSKCIYNYK
jgi:hypothetical protein